MRTNVIGSRISADHRGVYLTYGTGENNGDFYVKLWHDMDNVGIALWGYWI